MNSLRKEMEAGTGDISKQIIAFNALKDAIKIVDLD